MSIEPSFFSRSISRMNGYLFDALDPVMARVYEPYKKDLFSDALQRLPENPSILEIGAGAGANLRYLSPGSKLTVVEPCEAMYLPLKRRAETQQIDMDLVSCEAEVLPFDDEQFDLVISSLVLCTVQDPSLALQEVLRVLKPNSRFLFLEHVKADGLVLKTYQAAVRWPWSVMFCGCNLQRDTQQLIKDAGFGRLKLDQFCFRLPLLPFAPHIYGWGEK